MRHYLSSRCVLKLLERPSIYNMSSDELYELDEPTFELLKRCADEDGWEDDGCGRDFIQYAVEEGILTDRKAGGRRPPLRQSPAPSLRYLELQVTTRCNLRCRHCYIEAGGNEELSFKEVASILKEFEDMQGLRLLITGGEPLLYSQFDSLNDFLPSISVRKILLTNGILLTRERAESLRVDEIQISIDGLESGHDALRGNGTFAKTLSALESARGAGIDVSVSTMVHLGNLGEFDGMETLFRSLGVKDWTVDVPCVTGRLKDYPLFPLEPEVAGKYLNYGFGGGLHEGEGGFGCGLHLASVLARGKVAKCAFYEAASVGDVEEGLEVCWKRIMPVRLEALECDCDVREMCRGGCRYRAGLLGNPLGRDLYRCAAYEQKPGRGF